MLYYIAMMKDNINTIIPDAALFKTHFHYSAVESKTKIISPIHYHNLYELYFLEQGIREYIIGGEIYTVNAGSLVIIPPGLLHETSGSAFTRKLMHFSRSALEEFFHKKIANELLCVCDAPVYIPKDHTQRETIEKLFQQGRLYFLQGDYLGCIMTVAQILNNLKKMTVGEPKSAIQNNELIDKISIHLQKNATKIHNLEEIAKEFFISKSHLCHLFKKHKHSTVYDFLLKIKIEQASILLTTTNKKIKEICEECGFNSEYYFSRRFSIITGISPSKYRKEFSKYEK